jgi:hypothetical protein
MENLREIDIDRRERKLLKKYCTQRRALKYNWTKGRQEV